MYGWTKLYPFSKANEKKVMAYADELFDKADELEEKGDYENADKLRNKSNFLIGMFHKPDVNSNKVVWLTGPEIGEAKKVLAMVG